MVNRISVRFRRTEAEPGLMRTEQFDPFGLQFAIPVVTLNLASNSEYTKNFGSCRVGSGFAVAFAGQITVLFGFSDQTSPRRFCPPEMPDRAVTRPTSTQQTRTIGDPQFRVDCEFDVTLR